MTESIEFSVPATCANLGPGLGVLAVALDLPVAITATESDEEGHTVERAGTLQELSIDTRHDVILRGMHTAATRFEIKLPAGLTVRADSQIPPASGLGSHSATVAAGIALAARCAKKPPEPHACLDLLVELGGDPAHGAAALAGGLAAACQTSLPSGPPTFRIVRGELHASWRFVLACPDVRIPTADTRRILPPTMPHAVAPRSTGRVVGLLDALRRGDEEHLASFLYDETHVPFRRLLVPGIGAAMEAAREAGAAGVTISGHGPGVVALTTREDLGAPIADAMRAAFAAADQQVETLELGATFDGALPAAD